MLFADNAERATGLEILHVEEWQASCGKRIDLYFLAKGTYADSILAIAEETFTFLMKDPEFCEAGFYLCLREDVWTLEHGRASVLRIVLFILVQEVHLPRYYEMRTGEWEALRDFLNATCYMIPYWYWGGMPFEKIPNHYDARIEALRQMLPWHERSHPQQEETKPEASVPEGGWRWR